MKAFAKHWMPFWLVALTYLVWQIGTDLIAWLTAIGREGFNNLEYYDILLMLLNVIVSVCVTLRALQNTSYLEAKRRLYVPPSGDTEHITVKER